MGKMVSIEVSEHAIAVVQSYKERTEDFDYHDFLEFLDDELEDRKDFHLALVWADYQAQKNDLIK
ncbi:hypothetical protein EFL81_10045 [Weissella confusa]|uniref:hypothetical protein n=1 Tax=Weissella confusa TaxID=1583 RepID=UPI00223BBA25|nr:hypothetical protein [Weissella confusa]MCS9997152.1 hypothetical protein [Weissella confusa]